MLILIISNYNFCHTASGVNQSDFIFFLISLNISPRSNSEANCNAPLKTIFTFTRRMT